MDYTDILKRSWRITWKHKLLWLFGFFAGAASYGGGGRSYNFGGNFGNDFGRTFGGASGAPFSSLDQMTGWILPRLGLFIALAVVLFLVGLVFWVLSIAARGGLVYLGNEAAEERSVHAGPGWGTGFRKWGRTFLIGFLLGLPLWLVLILVGLPVVLAAIASFGRGGAAGSALGTALLGTCGLFVVAVVVLIPYLILVSVLYPLAIRHGILQDDPAVSSLRNAWRDLRTRFKDVSLMWVIQLGIDLAYGIAAGVLALAILAPAIVLFLSRAWLAGGVATLFGVLVLMLPGAVFATFQNNVWTVFFRRFTAVEAELLQHPTPAFAGASAPPPPPIPPAPMPPAPPAPELLSAPAPPEPPPDA